MVERGSPRKLILQHRFSESLKAEVPSLDSLGKKGKQALWWSARRNAPTKPLRGYKPCFQIEKEMSTLVELEQISESFIYSRLQIRLLMGLSLPTIFKGKKREEPVRY